MPSATEQPERKAQSHGGAPPTHLTPSDAHASQTRKRAQGSQPVRFDPVVPEPGAVPPYRFVKSRALSFLCTLLLVVGCGDDAPPDELASSTSGDGSSSSSALGSSTSTTAASTEITADISTMFFTLSDGTEIRVEPGGHIEARRGEHVFFSSSQTQLPELRRFTEVYQGGIGLWTVGRDAAESTGVGDFIDATMVDDVVTVRLGDTEENTFTVRIAVRTPFASLTITGSPAEAFDAIAFPLACDDESGFHGFGEQYGTTDQRGEAFRLWLTEQGIGRDPDLGLLPINGGTHTTYFPMPYFLDPRGFGGLFVTDLPVEVDLCATDPTTAWFEVRGDMEMIVFSGPSGYDVIEQLGDEVGRPSLPPAWAWEPWIGAQGGQDDVAAEVARLQQADIPFSAMWVQDWTGIRPNLQGGSGVEYRWRTDTELYPDLPGLIADLRADGIRFLGYANPFIDPDLDHFAAMSDGDMLVRNPDGEDYVAFAPNGLSAHPDFTAPQTEAYVQAELRAMVEDIGMDGFMADFGEWIPLDGVLADGSDPIAYHNRFPLHWHAQWRAVMDDVRPDGDFAVFARSGYTGVHDVAQIYWIGDQEADFSPFDGLPTVVPAMLNLGISGIPFVTHDISGFSGGPSTKELFMRWTELGSFTPIMRTHEGNLKDENWRWESDAETTAHFARFARVHVALADEIASLAEQAAITGIPIVRHLMLEFPGDLATRAISDAYLLGPDLLVAPIVSEGETQRVVYLPGDDTWFHVWTGEPYTGGTTIEIEAPIGSPPVFARGRDRTDLRTIN